MGAMQPFIAAAIPGLPAQEQAAHVFRFQAILQIMLGACVVMAFISRQTERPASARPALAGKNVGLLLAGSALFFMLFGLAAQAPFPKVGNTPDVVNDIHLANLLLVPLFGLLLSQGRGKWAFIVIIAIALAGLFALWLEWPQAILLFLLFAGRMFLQMLLWILLGRIFRQSPFLPFLLLSVYCMMLLQPVGWMLGITWSHLLGYPHGPALLALVFAFALAAAFMLLRGKLTPWLQNQDDQPADTGESDQHKLVAFGQKHQLTMREMEVLEGLVAGMSINDVCVALGIGERTVRHHLTGIMAKAGVKSSKMLIKFYSHWQDRMKN